jgi:hypothetical protein
MFAVMLAVIVALIGAVSLNVFQALGPLAFPIAGNANPESALQSRGAQVVAGQRMPVLAVRFEYAHHWTHFFAPFAIARLFPNAGAGATPAMGVAIPMHELDVIPAQRMTSNAMRLVRVRSRFHDLVDIGRDTQQMVRVAAGRVFTDVVNVVAGRNWPAPDLPSRAMGPDHRRPLASGTDHSVPEPVLRACEFPASRLRISVEHTVQAINEWPATMWFHNHEFALALSKPQVLV